MIDVIFALFAVAALALFWFFSPRTAVLTTCFAGWLLLPVGNFPAGSANSDFPYWITGAAVPSDMLVTKMWWPPVIALLGALCADRQFVKNWRPRWIDVPMLLWCLWPIGQSIFITNPEPNPLTSSLYLTGAWGTPWILGRSLFSSPEFRLHLISALVAGLLVITPIAIIEGAVGPKLYDWLYELHPFRADGAVRYIGFRPLGFFEHGTQYGIWVAATALGAIWLWTATCDPHTRRFLSMAAIWAMAVALMSQSVGAILLLCGGLVLQSMRLMRWLLPAFLILMIAGAAIYASRLVPIDEFAKNTTIGRKIVQTIKSTGRGSITWRVARDQRALSIIASQPVVGNGHWDWWKQDNGERPWSLAMLILGQFGLPGLILSFGSLLVPALSPFVKLRRSDAVGIGPAIPLAVIVLMALGDALFNSFFFYPAILAAGALAHPLYGEKSDFSP